jgi:hypothetical protein
MWQLKWIYFCDLCSVICVFYYAPLGLRYSCPYHSAAPSRASINRTQFKKFSFRLSKCPTKLDKTAYEFIMCQKSVPHRPDQTLWQKNNMCMVHPVPTLHNEVEGTRLCKGT